MKFIKYYSNKAEKNSSGYEIRSKREFNTLGRNCHINLAKDFARNSSFVCVHKA